MQPPTLISVAATRAAFALALLGASACGLEELQEPAEPTLAEVAQEVAVCADGPTTYGIDVSRYQGDIDWQLVANSGVKYAFIQISRSLTDIDAKFTYNWRRAKEVGILRGAYQRFQPDQDVLGQANLFLSKLGPFQAGDLPPVLDVEDAGGLTATQISQRVRQWVDHVEAAVGVKPIIYTGYYFWKDSVGGADFKDHPLWIANYSATCPLVPQQWSRWAIHQYSSTARIPGITANTVDVNKFNGTLAELKALGTRAVCGDATCNGDETPDSCAADCKPCQLIAGDGETIVDDSSACFRTGGDPQYIREEAAGYGSSLQWTHATDAATPSNYGRWTLHFASPGRYRVEAYTPAPFNGSQRAVYDVRHGEVRTPVTVNQSAVDGWNLIGELDFVEGGFEQAVRVNDNTSEANATNTKIVFDALRFTRLDGTPPRDGDPADDADGGGCSTTGGGASWLLIALLGLVLRARRRPRT
ncbi:MAG: MYXO-CTERM sorting domain-containing protein, partial [Myxococcota bacterium]|nr:MYXO-CTERM sorting domain-containing protein [Myxococcota bacterium]